MTALHRAGAVVLLLATAAAQEPAEVVTISVPAAMVESVAPGLQQRFGERVRVESLAAAGLELPAGPRLLLLCDEWQLARLAAVGALELVPPVVAQRFAPPAAPAGFVLPFLGEYALAIGVDLHVPRSWEDLALDPDLHDRLGIVGPEVDGSPWLLCMRECLDRGQGQGAGLSLWTTIDARAGRLAGSYATLLGDLDAGRLAAVVGPNHLLRAAVAQSRVPLRLAPLAAGGKVRFGLALTTGAGPALREVAERLTDADSLGAIAAAAGLTRAPPESMPLPADAALEWWHQFERDVRGRGRSTERLADWLDLSFGVLFLVCLWFVWRSCREPGPERE